ncbi:MAG: ABC transporter substrate-binding protein [Bdellovibrionales bacterium]|nr:ABC transporter substrate-binding protein [Bdellovibrionales bacterium]
MSLRAEIIALLASTALAAFAAPSEGALVDALGREIKVPAASPKRVVTLAPSLAELAADVLGAELDAIVGVSEYTDYPRALERATKVGPFHRFNLESVVALKPDLVLATADGNPSDRVLRLQELGLNVVVVDTSTLAGVEHSFRLAGLSLGRPKDGEALAGRFKAGLQAFRGRAAARAGLAPRVLFQLDREPLVSVGGGTFLQEALSALGAENALSDLRTRYPRPALEEVVRRDPDWILILAMDGRESGAFRRMADDWKPFTGMKAVKAGQVRVLDASELGRPSMRLLSGLSRLERELFPGALP